MRGNADFMGRWSSVAQDGHGFFRSGPAFFVYAGSCAMVLALRLHPNIILKCGVGWQENSVVNAGGRDAKSPSREVAKRRGWRMDGRRKSEAWHVAEVPG